jgi:PKD repeat protein/streptogramin lyase
MATAHKSIVRTLNIFAAFVLFCTHAWANVAAYPQLMTFGTYGEGSGDFKNPYAVAVDGATGDIYIADTGNSKIKKFNRLGQLLGAFGAQGSADGEFLFPQGVALDNNGNLYVADTANNRVQKFNISGNNFTFVSKFGSPGSGNGQFNLPRDIAIDGSGNVYVCDSGNNRISKFAPSGGWVSNIGGSSSLKGPYGFGLDGAGNVYVADTYNHRVVKFGPNGAVLMYFGSYGAAAGQFSYPRDVVVDNEGNIFVADTENHRVQRFDGSGNYLNSFGVYTEFLTPQKIFLDNEHRMHVVDSNTNRVQVYDVTTYLKDVYAAPSPFSPDGDGIQDTTAIHYTIPEPARITITIYDNNSNLVKSLLAGATRLTDRNTDIWDGTDNGGLPVTAGVYTIKIDAVNMTNYHPPQQLIAVSVIHPTGVVSGMVTDGTHPVAGASVSDGARSSLTDANGNYTLVNVPAGEIVVSASKSGYKDGRQIINVTDGGTTAGVDFALNRIGDPDMRVSPGSLSFIGLPGGEGLSGMSLLTAGIQPQVTVSQEAVSNKLNYEIKLKSKKFTPVKHEAQAQKDVADKAKKLKKEKIHVLVQLEKTPTDAEKKTLKEAGIELLSYVPNHAWIASVTSAKASGLIAVPLVRWAGVISAQDKISSVIQERGVAPHAINKNGTVNLRIQFFKNVLPDAAGQILAMHSGSVVNTSKLLNVMTVSVPASSIAGLADEDAVQWIEEVSPTPIEHNDGIREDTGVNVVQDSPYSLDGSNVVIGIWDGGHVDATHDDFGSRVVYGDSAEIGLHATHVAGTASGAGTLSALLSGSANQWKGMAPDARIVSYEWTDAVAEHEPAVNNHWIDISQNSWGYLVDSNNCSFFGDYTLTEGEYDAIVRGGFGKPVNVVFSAGNERNRTDCGIPARGGYSTIASPATGKNIITVGAVNSDNNTMTSFSSWGPVDDGRIKPDLVAPGCEAGGEGYIHSTMPGDIYGGHGWCGTSMAAPTVSGITALMIEQFRTAFSADPLPSTVKGTLIHTARDLENPGPDYKTGFGVIDAKSAVDIIKDRALFEGAINNTGEINTYTIEVPQGITELKVTLAWDDAPGSPNSASELINDLDLVLVSPQGAQYLPWKLDPANPAAPATTGPDHVNNVEQVFVASPAAGTWTVRVTGTAVPHPAQSYSLVSNRFGSAELKYAAQKIATLYNDGDSALVATSITSNQPWLSVDRGSLNLAPGTSAGIKVAVNGTGMNFGTYYGQIEIRSNDPNESLVAIPVAYSIDSPPLAILDGPYAASEGQTMTINGSGSSDPDGTIILYQWDVNNDGTYEYSTVTPVITHTYAQQGTYTIKLRVTDDQGATGETATAAFISDTMPIADFTGAPTAGLAPLTVTFTNSSTGYDQPLTYEWDFENDGIVDSTEVNPSHIYNTPGIYSVKLRVTDADGSVSSIVLNNYIILVQHSLTVTKRGNGTITSAPAGIACGSTCGAAFTAGLPVTLTATSDAGWNFVGWSGACTGTGTCDITMDGDKTLQARFVEPDKIGVYRSSNSSWYLDLNGNYIWDGVDTLYTSFTSTPVTGDWDGDGVSEVGAFVGNGMWRLDINGDGLWNPDLDVEFKFGMTGDVPITGDWNGDGITDIGVFRASGYWYLDQNGNHVWEADVDSSLRFGISGDAPVTGDWNGDGITDVGVFRAGGNWHLDLNGNRVWDAGVDGTYKFGITGDVPVAGDWNLDGVADIGIFRGNGKWYLDLNGNRVWEAGADGTYTFGISGDLPITGKW